MREELVLMYVEEMPDTKETGILYISERYQIAIHLCACGCGIQSVTPISESEWKLTKNEDDTVTLTPSIGNFNGQIPYHAHYFITNNKVIWI